MFVSQVRSSDDHLEVNIDPLLIEVLSEIHYLSRPPLSVRLPVSLRQLVKAIDFKQLKHRKTSLEVCMYSYQFYSCRCIYHSISVYTCTMDLDLKYCGIHLHVLYCLAYLYVSKYGVALSPGPQAPRPSQLFINQGGSGDEASHIEITCKFKFM